jgi:hypothetical protein
MGKHLGAQLGMVEEAGLYDFPDKARIVKIRVHLDIHDPIRPGIFIGNTKDGIQWIDFRYENLPMFCFLCGIIGHNENSCSSQPSTLEEGGINPRGPWLRSNNFGRRVQDKKDTRFSSNPMQSMSGGNYSPIPKAMLDMLARMRLEEENPTTSSTPNSSQSAHRHNSEPNGSTMKIQLQGQQGPLKDQGSSTSQQLINTEMAGLQSKASQRQ